MSKLNGVFLVHGERAIERRTELADKLLVSKVMTLQQVYDGERVVDNSLIVTNEEVSATSIPQCGPVVILTVERALSDEALALSSPRV